MGSVSATVKAMRQWKNPLAPFLDIDEMSVLVRAQKEIDLVPRKMVFQENQPIDQILVICFGSVRIEKKREGSLNVIYSFKRRGDLLGVFAYLNPSAGHIASAVTLESSKFLAYPKDVFLGLVERSPTLQREIKRQISVNFQDLQVDRELEKACTQERLAAVLLSLYESQGEVKSQSILMPLSKTDLARRIGAEPETVIRILNGWEKAGLIRSKDRIYEICDYDHLRRKVHSYGSEKRSS